MRSSASDSFGVILIAGITFSLLKLVPGVAEAVAPVLGGVMLRDPSDLLALTVLLPIWLSTRPRGSMTVVPSPIGRSRLSDIWTGIRTTLTTVAPIVGLVFATAATTATSCAPHQAVVTVTAEGQDLYAVVATSVVSERWVISEDGGRTWQGTEPPSTASSTSTTVDLYDDPGALILFGPVLALVTWLVGRRRWQSWRKGLAVVAAGWLATIEAAARPEAGEEG